MNTIHGNSMHSMQRQRGISMVVVLLFLVIMMGLGTTAIRTATIEEKLSGNERDQQIAFEAAEAALRDGERYARAALNAGSGFSTGCANGLCLPSASATTQWDTVDWTGGIPRVYGSLTGAGTYPDSSISRAPRFIVELLPDMTPGAGNSLGLGTRSLSGAGTPFRITAVGWGRRASTQVMLQSVYVRQ
jgi:type IV pilus assembly protein PilX